MKKIAVIPCYNVDIENLKKIVKNVNCFVDPILVIDDGSTPKIDLTGCIILRNKEKKGKGYSLRRAFRYALKHKFDIIITLDGDGEHNPQDIIKFEKKIEENELVLGQRIIYRSKLRTMLNQWADIWFRLLIPKIRDASCGFRAIKSGLLKKMRLASKGFEIETEMLLEAIKNKAKIEMVDIQTNINDKSNIRFSDWIKINNLFDKWVLKNKNYINAHPLKKKVLITGAVIGLKIGRLAEWTFQKY